MFGFFERQRLVKRGFAASKQRRRRTDSEWQQTLEYGPLAKALVCIGFLTGLAALLLTGPVAQRPEKLLIALLIFLTALAQLWINHPKTFDRNSRLLLMFVVILLHLGLVKFALGFAVSQGQMSGGELSGFERKDIWDLAVPYAFGPLLLSVLFGRNHGIFAAIYVSLWGSMFGFAIDPQLLVMSLICGFIAVFVTLQVRRRSRLIRAGFFVGLATLLLAMLFGKILVVQLAGVVAPNWEVFGWQVLAAVLSGVVPALLISGALPIFEGLFGITTEISWIEMADLNHPLLKRMMIEAPGTYQHSLVVATLAEAACETIGANATMARVCSYFHDIGKLIKPDYFTENMRHGRNPHDELAPTMSALIIVAHVKEGVDLALKYNLCQEIVDVIQQHHGTTLVFYFYKRALQQQEDARAGGKIMNIREEDIPDVREESFRYSGPRPQARECAVISLADCIESASRSLERVTPQKIDQLIRDIIDKRLVDGQLKECDLTMRELEEVCESFRNTLQSMMHSRIAYPEDTKPTKSGLHQPPSSKTRAPMSAA
ncbi:MAG: HDIG domain-containing metalloprotein [Chthoniobacteraceae bacterium]